MNIDSFLSSKWSVLILSRHDPQAASSRLRTMQYIPFLKAAGAAVTVAPFFSHAYLKTLYESNGRSWNEVAKAYARRFQSLFEARKCSVVWVEKEIFPFLPGWSESILGRLNVPYVVDYDDATFHTYDQHPSTAVRAIMRNKLDPLLRAARAVTVGNSYLGSYVHQHGARNILKIPTVVDTSRYFNLPEPPADELRVGWIGTPATTKYLELLRAPLRAVAETQKVRLVTIGAAPLTGFGIPIEQHAWSWDREGELLSSLHIGVMPLPDNPWERGKCGYKLIQYMATGRPVIASPVGINSQIVSEEVGFLAPDAAAWENTIRRLAKDQELRIRMGKAGRIKVEHQFSIEIMGPRIADILMQAAGVIRP